MRDKKRIRQFCERLALAWEKVPDLRFWQLVDNVSKEMCYAPLFYMEDGDMIKLIETYCERIVWNPGQDERMGGKNGKG